MLYNINQKLNLWPGRFLWLKRILLVFVLSSMLVISCSCTLLTEPLDNRTGFSKYLTQVEINIRNEEWYQAKISLEDSKIAWKKLKPLLQVDVDHDYIKDIEDGFIKLDAYLDTKDKSNSLASILLVQGTWENIGSL